MLPSWCLLCRDKRIKKADNAFVSRDEVASILRGTTHIDPEQRSFTYAIMHSTMRACDPLGLPANGGFRGCLLSFNSQLWGELQPIVPRKGLQPVAFSLCSFTFRLLFPVHAFEMFPSL